MSSGVKKGDTPDPRKSPGGEQQPTPDDTDAARQNALAKKIMRDDRELLRALAK